MILGTYDMEDMDEFGWLTMLLGCFLLVRFPNPLATGHSWQLGEPD